MQEPDEELLKGSLHPCLFFALGNHQTGNVAGPCYLFDFVKVVGFRDLITTGVLFTEFFGEWFVGGTEVLSNDLFGDVATYVFPVVALFFLFWLFCAWFEYLNLLTLLVFRQAGCEVKNQSPFFVDGPVDEFTKQGVVGPGSFDVQEHLQLVVVEVLV